MVNPAILGEDETIGAALAGKSIARMGEGELKLAVKGMNLKSQLHTPKLANELKRLTSEPSAALICLPRNFAGMPNEPFWRRFEVSDYSSLYRLPQYGSAFISRPDMVNAIDRPEYWAQCERLWAGQDVTLVSRHAKVLNLSQAASVRFVAGPATNAYAEIDRIEEEVGRPSGPVLLALGPTATVLAVRLANRGVHALDIGHLGKFMAVAGVYSMERQTLISEVYVEQNRRLHKRPEGYGGSGHKSAAVVAAYAKELGAEIVLDYGCGRGTLKTALLASGFSIPVIEYDPAIKGKAGLPKPADLVACTDVLEHCEPDRLAAVLAHIHRLAGKGAYLLIATRPANKVLDDGRNAHLLVKPAAWWVDQVTAAGFSIARRDGKEGHDLKLWCRK